MQLFVAFHFFLGRGHVVETLEQQSWVRRGCAPISTNRFLHRIHLLNADGAAAIRAISVGSARFLNNACFSITPPGQYKESRYVMMLKARKRRAEMGSSLTPSGTACRIIEAILRSNLCQRSCCKCLGGTGSCCILSKGGSDKCRWYQLSISFIMHLHHASRVENKSATTGSISKSQCPNCNGPTVGIQGKKGGRSGTLLRSVCSHLPTLGCVFWTRLSPIFR